MQSTTSVGLKDFETAHGEPESAVGGSSHPSAGHVPGGPTQSGRDEGLSGECGGRATAPLSLLGSRAWLGGTSWGLTYQSRRRVPDQGQLAGRFVPTWGPTKTEREVGGLIAYADSHPPHHRKL